MVWEVTLSAVSRSMLSVWIVSIASGRDPLSSSSSFGSSAGTEVFDWHGIWGAGAMGASCRSVAAARNSFYGSGSAHSKHDPEPSIALVSAQLTRERSAGEAWQVGTVCNCGFVEPPEPSSSRY